MRKNFPKLTKKHLDTYDEFSYIVYSMSEDDFCKLKEVFGIGKNKDYPYAKFISSFSEEDQKTFAINDISVFEKHIRLCCHQRDFIQKNSIKSLEIAEEAKEIAGEANKVKGKIYSEFIAIIGVTGSGKSSLVMSLCRIIESDIGEILIDNVDIRKLNLQFLRQNITIVPQDIFLMEGTLKENIDPLNKKSENEIIEILNKYSIFPEITDNNERLNFYIKQNGDNLSIGQKQLICFSRAGIIKSKILILDEATSYVDLQTEKIIKTNLENDFKDSTVIIIAHHIQMVSHCEKILVVENGKIIETGTYNKLLNDKKSKFYALYNESLAN